MTRIFQWILLISVIAAPAAAKDLEIYFIDVEGGQATLIVAPEGQSLLVDAGYGRSSRDPDRIMRAVEAAGIERIDYLLVTHYHGDHVGGIPELASRIPIGTFVDYGSPLGTLYGPDRMTMRSFATYETVRATGSHLTPRPGDRLPLSGLDVTVVSSGGELLSSPLPDAGQPVDSCGSIGSHPEDGTENFRSLGFVLRFGGFSFVNLGDLNGDTLSKIICPRNLLGEASVYLIAHHGDYDSDSEAMYAALRPRVAVMNNGARKGGDPATLKTVHNHGGIDLWQLHASENPGAQNSPDELIANLDDQECPGHWIKLVASNDGSFSVTNGRTGLTRSYAGKQLNTRR